MGVLAGARHQLACCADVGRTDRGAVHPCISRETSPVLRIASASASVFGSELARPGSPCSYRWVALPFGGAPDKERGLVDTIGRDVDALRSVAMRGGSGRVRNANGRGVCIGPEPAMLTRSSIADPFDLSVMVGALPSQFARVAQQESGWLETVADEHRPLTTMARCLCDKPRAAPKRCVNAAIVSRAQRAILLLGHL